MLPKHRGYGISCLLSQIFAGNRDAFNVHEKTASSGMEAVFVASAC